MLTVAVEVAPSEAPEGLDKAIVNVSVSSLMRLSTVSTVNVTSVTPASKVSVVETGI